MSRPRMDDDAVHDAAFELIRALATVAGDPEAVRQTFEALAEQLDPGDVVTVALTALRTTYAECIAGPSTLDPSSPIPVDIPTPYEGDFSCH